MFDELAEAKYSKEMKRLKTLQLIAKAYLGPKRASLIKLSFI